MDECDGIADDKHGFSKCWWENTKELRNVYNKAHLSQIVL